MTCATPGTFGVTVARAVVASESQHAIRLTDAARGRRRRARCLRGRSRPAATSHDGPARDAGAGLWVEPPAIRERVAVGVARAAGVEHERCVESRLHHHGGRPARAVHDDQRVVIRGLRAHHRPGHPGGEVVLERLAPPPDRRLVRGVPLAVGATHGIARRGQPSRIRVATLGPEGPRLAVRLAPHVAPTPSTMRRAHATRQTVVDQAEEGRRVALVDAARVRVQRAEWPTRTDVGIDPGVAERPEVGTRRVAVEVVAADARPGGRGILLPILSRGHGDVVQVGELAAQPGAGVVLIRDGVDPQARHGSAQLIGRELRARIEQGLCQGVGPTPHRDPQWPRVVAAHGGEQERRSRRRLPHPGCRNAVSRLPCRDQFLEVGSRGEAGGVAQQVRLDFGVSVEHAMQHVGSHARAKPGRGRRDEALDVEVVRVHEEPHERHLVVRLVGDVGEDEDARPADVGVIAGRRRCGRRLSRRQRGSLPCQQRQRQQQRPSTTNTEPGTDAHVETPRQGRREDTPRASWDGPCGRSGGAGGARGRGAGHLEQPATPHVVDEAVHGNRRRHQRVLPDARHVIHHALPLVLDRQPVDVLARRRPRPGADIGEPLRRQLRGLEAVAQQPAHDLIGEELHPAIGVVDDEPLSGAEQLVRDHQRPDGIVARPSTGIADHVGVAFGQTCVLGRVEPRVHAGEDGEAARGRQREAALVAERLGVAGVGGEDGLTCLAHGSGSFGAS